MLDIGKFIDVPIDSFQIFGLVMDVIKILSKECFTNALNVKILFCAAVVDKNLNAHRLARQIMNCLNFHQMCLELKLTFLRKWNLMSTMYTMITFVREMRNREFSGGKIF